MDPSIGSRHNRGCAVDLSLFDLKTGAIVQMPSEYDEMTERAHINYACAREESMQLRDFLRAAMEAEGFEVYEPEWWHYDYKGLARISDPEPELLKIEIASDR